ncbi:hypothetical protein SAMD00019534_110430 [Acytostelium subglobosum LB1]|uniref:hypothetical protein n=1 Tax=Acytostelium subglobosum LB1 TaxID=1410327 RepID=UPI00064481F1|nr:hypothetical protein SAMD00019534_110430 [Acytostelium subglobosum LB1]GAM27867.1 hypothetical protein SAMD00019534_110430 [Acytostelium subglobosum LB1]|eukprot:XP_012749150.1 hypothetical protein SAMD00019534_110430 [Acytostelium subglobosum LB1]
MKDVDEVKTKASIISLVGYWGKNWKKCSSGHLYLVDACGDPHGETGKCIDCKVKVGKGDSNAVTY